MAPLKKSELYRFPWSLNDNPIGWLEVTDVCNIHCKGCYRKTLEGHRPLADLQEEILLMKEYRNIDNVSIAGGEPLTHPDIDALIVFIRKLGVKPYLLTNGRAVTLERMRELKKLGVAGVAIHVDMMQKREGWKDEDELGLMPLRDRCVEIMAEVGGVPTSFGITVYKENFRQIPDIVRWGVRNIKHVQGLTFITYRGALVREGVKYIVDGREIDMDVDKLGYATADDPEDFNITADDVYRIIKEYVPGYDASAYLGGSQRHDSFKWLIGYMVGDAQGYYGPVGPKTVELAQTLHHFLRGTYFAYTWKPGPGRKVLLAALFDPVTRATTARYLANPFRLFKGVYGQSIGIVQAPDALDDGRVDMCDACPDMTVYKGQLIHSCRMDEWRRWGGYMTQIKAWGVDEEEGIPSDGRKARGRPRKRPVRV